MLGKLMEYMSYPFVQYALIAGVLIAMCSSVLGVVLVLKRFSFIGDSLSHVAFTFQTVAIVFGLTGNMFLIIPGTILCAVYLFNGTKEHSDAELAVFSVGALAIGYITINVFGKSANVSADVCSSLFGSTSILALTPLEVGLCVGISVLVGVLFIIFYDKIFAMTFDEIFCKAVGYNTKLYNFMVSIVISLVIVLALKLVGSLLISALIIFPALSTMKLFKTFGVVVLTSLLFGVVTSVTGILVSILWGTPVGSTIVEIQIVFYLICRVLSRCLHIN